MTHACLHFFSSHRTSVAFVFGVGGGCAVLKESSPRVAPLDLAIPLGFYLGLVDNAWSGELHYN